MVTWVSRSCSTGTKKLVVTGFWEVLFGCFVVLYMSLLLLILQSLTTLQKERVKAKVTPPDAVRVLADTFWVKILPKYFYLPIIKILTQLFCFSDPQVINDIPKASNALGTDPSLHPASCYFPRLYSFLRKDANSPAFARPRYSTHSSLNSEKPTTSATLCCYRERNIKLIMTT